MEININLEQTSADNFATFHGWTAENELSQADFITAKILDRVSNDLLEKASRDAIAAVVPIADVTSDGIQTSLREAIVSAQAVKLEAMQEPVETFKDSLITPEENPDMVKA